jgi:hypothetical protein
MFIKFLSIGLLLLTACQGTQSHDPSLLSFRIPEGSTLALNKPLEIPAGNTHALLQSGELIRESDSKLYEISCRFDVRSFGPRTIEPEVFRIRRTEDGQRRVSDAGIWAFFSEIHLDSDKGTDVIMLRCQSWGYGMHWHFSVADMKTALGDYFTFTFSQSDKTN